MLVEKWTHFSFGHVGQRTSPMTSRIVFCVSSKIYIRWSHVKKIISFCCSKEILRPWHVDPHWGQWLSLLSRDEFIFFCTKSMSELNSFGRYTFPSSLEFLSDRQAGVNVLHIVIALKHFPFVCNVLSVLVEVVTLAMVRVSNFVRENWLPCSSNFRVENSQEFLFPNRNDKRIFLYDCSMIL